MGMKQHKDILKGGRRQSPDRPEPPNKSPLQGN